MNKDTITTILGAVMAVGLAVAAFAAPEGTPLIIQAAGYIGAVGMAIFGYFTNKK